MYYLIRNNLNGRRCISKNQQDIYAPNMNIGCSQSLPFPNNIQLIRQNNIRCTGSGNTTDAEVYCDFVTAHHLNLI
jgi:hypothetical protein